MPRGVSLRSQDSVSQDVRTSDLRTSGSQTSEPQESRTSNLRESNILILRLGLGAGGLVLDLVLDTGTGLDPGYCT